MKKLKICIREKLGKWEIIYTLWLWKKHVHKILKCVLMGRKTQGTKKCLIGCVLGETINLKGGEKWKWLFIYLFNMLTYQGENSRVFTIFSNIYSMEVEFKGF